MNDSESRLEVEKKSSFCSSLEILLLCNQHISYLIFVHVIIVLLRSDEAGEEISGRSSSSECNRDGGW